MTNTADNITTIRTTEYNHHIHCVSASVMLQANGKTCSIILRYLAFSPVFPIFTFRYMIDYV